MSASPSKPIIPVLIASLVAILLFWLGTQVIAALAPTGSTEESDRAAVRAQNLADLNAANQEALETYGWVNKEKGVVRVPIRQAMEMVLPELNARKPAAAYPIATPAAPAAGSETPAPETPDAATETPSEPAAPAEQ